MLYIDNECKCHLSNPDGIYTALDTPEELIGKAPAYIEGFRVKPEGYSFAREDGKVFGPDGYSVSPWRDLNLLNEFQAQYEAQLTAAEEAYQEGVNAAYD